MHVNGMGQNDRVLLNLPLVYRGDVPLRYHVNVLMQTSEHVFLLHEKMHCHDGDAESSREQPPSEG